MQCSLPILASINTGNDLKTVLEDSGAGLCSINGQDETFCMNALRLAKDSELRQRMGQNARHLLEKKFSAASSAKQILVNSELAWRQLSTGRKLRDRRARPRIAISSSTRTAS
jgi:hypothetical protein